MRLKTCRIRDDLIEVFKFLNGFIPLTHVYFLNMIREIEEHIQRNSPTDDADLRLESMCLVIG